MRLIVRTPIVFRTPLVPMASLASQCLRQFAAMGSGISLASLRALPLRQQVATAGKESVSG